MEIKKGDRFRCIKDCHQWYTKGKIYESEIDGRITNDNFYEGHIWEGVGYFNEYFERVSDSPTSPSHYKTYDIEAIEMMIRIWGKEEAAIFCKLNAFKYRLRMGMKDDVQIELEKESKYLAKWKELRDGE